MKHVPKARNSKSKKNGVRIDFPIGICLTSENSSVKLREVEGSMAGIILISLYPFDFTRVYIRGVFVLSISAVCFNL